MRLKLIAFAALGASGWNSVGAAPADEPKSNEVANAAECKTVDECLSAFNFLSQPAPETEDPWKTPPPPWEGVWQGTVGTAPVHVCLDRTPYTMKGAYYYDRIKKLLRLVPVEEDADNGNWFEQESYGKNGARWRVSAQSGELIGTWSDGKKELPVRLKRIGGPSEEYEGPCGSMAFLGPRVTPLKLTSKWGVKDGVRFKSWTFTPGPWFGREVEISTFTLDRTGPNVAKVNALLRAALPAKNGTGEWLECVAGNVQHMGQDGTYYKIIEPTLISERWLAANEHGEYYCGGAHPDNVNIPRTFDLLDGTEVNPLDWLSDAAVHREELEDYGTYTTLKPAFVAAILRKWPAGNDDECMESTRTFESWHVGIARGALVFSPNFPRVIMACGDDYKMTFADLQPWLNAKGKAAVAMLPR